MKLTSFASFTLFAFSFFTVAMIAPPTVHARSANAGAPTPAPAIQSSPKPQVEYSRTYDGACRMATAQPYLDDLLATEIEMIKDMLRTQGIEITTVRHNRASEIGKIVRVPGVEVQALAPSRIQLVSIEGVVFDVQWSGQRLDPNGPFLGNFGYVNSRAMYFGEYADHDNSGRVTDRKCRMYDKTESAKIFNHETGYEIVGVGFQSY